MDNVISVIYLLHVRLFIHPSRYRVISTRHGFAISWKFLKLKLRTCWRIHIQVATRSYSICHPFLSFIVYVIPFFHFEISKFCSRTYNHSASADAQLPQPVAKLPQLPLELHQILGKKGANYSLAAVELGMEIMSHGMSAQTARLQVVLSYVLSFVTRLTFCFTIYLLLFLLYFLSFFMVLIRFFPRPLF